MSIADKNNLLARFTMKNAEVRYVGVPIRDGKLGAQILWKDAVSSATISLQLTSNPGVSIDSDGAAWDWADSGLTITGPAASAAGSALVNVENCRQEQARLKLTAAAASNFEVWDGTAP